MIAIDLSKQQVLDVISRAIQQINFTQNLDRAAGAFMLFCFWRTKKNCFGLFTRNCKSILTTQYNSLDVKLSNSQFNKLKSAIKNETEEVLRLSSNMIGNSDDETYFPQTLLSAR